MKTHALALLLTLVLIACKKNNGGNNPPPPPPPSGSLAITSTSPQYVFWGDDLTINGSGFSANAADNIVYIKGNKSCSSDSTWQKAQVVSASANKLVVKVPFVTNPSGSTCGNDWGRVRVTAAGKSVTRDSVVKFVGTPVINLCNPFGITVGNYPNTIRPGDSSVMTVHLSTLYTRESGFYDKIRLTVNGAPLPSVDRIFPGSTCNGLTFLLHPSQYADVNECTVPAGYGGGKPARKMTFAMNVEGTNKTASTEVWVLYQPNAVITSPSPFTLFTYSKSAGGNPTINLQGRNMYFTDIRWTSTKPTFHTQPPPHDFNTTNMGIYIPLSLMSDGVTYTAFGVGACGEVRQLFLVGVTP